MFVEGMNQRRILSNPPPHYTFLKVGVQRGREISNLFLTEKFFHDFGGSMLWKEGRSYEKPYLLRKECYPLLR